MAIYRAVGKTLVSQEEHRDLATSKEIADTLDAGREVVFEHGPLTSHDIAEAVVPFQPIGMSKPLRVQIRHVYTGRFPKKRRNMLLTSAMKSVAQFDAAPRAINFMTDKLEANSNESAPAATEKGTPLVYYSPALTKGASVITLELGFDNFDPSFMKSVGGVLEGAAGIPAFVTASPYLIGAGLVVKLAAGLAERFLEKGPVFSVTEPIDFITPGSTMPEAGFRLLVANHFPKSVLSQFHIGNGGSLVDASSASYSGDWPYVTISLDGAEVKEYESFEPTQASAAILQSFFNIRDDQEAPLDVILDGLKLYNDFKFRLEADGVGEQLKGLDPNSEKAKKLTERYEALKKNILQKELRPQSLESHTGVRAGHMERLSHA